MSAKLFPRIQSWVYLLAGAAWIASAQRPNDAPTTIATLQAEVRRLAVELLQQRAEFIQWKIDSIQVQLLQTQTERQRLAIEREEIERELGELNQASTHNPAAEDEERKQELTTLKLPALLAREQAVTAQETALAAALTAETKRLAQTSLELQARTAEPHSPK
jgi:hypothetical protein